ncbi:MAG: hypothetical protein IJ715_03870 [Bacilli bacterium]|nr:hypothetical protein [Bacilli bacterium]
MKRIIKNPVMMYILGIITCTLTTVLASSLLAGDITYKPKDKSWGVTNVQAAIDSLKLAKTSDNYSTDERVIGTWIDGKPLYQKTYVANGIRKIDNISTRSSWQIFDISNISADVVFIDGSSFYMKAYRESDGWYAFFPTSAMVNHIDTNSTMYYYVVANRNAISLLTNGMWWQNESDSTAKIDISVTIRYTKTTD